MISSILLSSSAPHVLCCVLCWLTVLVTKIRTSTQRDGLRQSEEDSVQRGPMTMDKHGSLVLLFTLLLNGTQALELGMGLLKELGSFPLKDNPFFAKVVALGGNFNSEAIIDLTLDSTGYDCQMLGDLDCDEEDFPKCSGSYERLL